MPVPLHILGCHSSYCLPCMSLQVLGVGQRKVSLSRMRMQLERVKACLGWLPRRLDPVALYHWHTPWHNLLLLWVLSQVQEVVADAGKHYMIGIDCAVVW